MPSGSGSRPAIEIEGLTKAYRTPQKGRGRGRERSRPILCGVDLKVHQGEILGLVGANGAGKTTLLKILAAILAPDAGWARVDGWDVVKDSLKARASSTLVKSGGWTGLLYQCSVLDNLRFYGKLCGLGSAEVDRRARELLEFLDLGAKAAELPWYLSAGQRQKVSLATMAMVVTPVVLLDEPTTHLDPIGAARVEAFIASIMNRTRGQAVLLCTHYLEQAERLCGRVAVIDGGRVLACDTPAALRAAYARESVQACVRGCSSQTLKNLSGLSPGIRFRPRCLDAVTQRYILQFHPDGPVDLGFQVIIDALRSAGVEILWAKSIPPSLREVYLSLVGRDIA